ncbi:hypothetical protein Leryth_026708 [Lithospermum erythrorhizon]|nr:hypothetical protein Leryth_026708 [Lithospermum erythrorhizon]
MKWANTDCVLRFIVGVMWFKLRIILEVPQLGAYLSRNQLILNFSSVAFLENRIRPRWSLISTAKICLTASTSAIYLTSEWSDLPYYNLYQAIDVYIKAAAIELHFNFWNLLIST